MTPYHARLNELRQAFPAVGCGAASEETGAKLFSAISAALEQTSALENHGALLGKPRTLDYSAARRQRLAAAPLPLPQVIDELAESFSGMTAFAHPLAQMNVEPLPTMGSIVGGLLAAIYNPNLCSDESARGVSEIEVAVTAMTAELVGYDPARAGGLFTFGGTGALAYGLRLGLEKALPGALAKGHGERPVVLASAASHYACRTVAGWLGIGHENVLLVETEADGGISLAALARQARRALSEGRPLAGIIATLGTTDAFALDDLPAIVQLRDELAAEFALPYRPHVHADAVIGWAWSVLAAYDRTANKLELPAAGLLRAERAAPRIGGLALADSMGIDFHKTGFAPYVSTLVLVREREDLALLARSRETAPYIFHSGENHPGLYSFETTRSAGGALAAFASLRLLGRDGLCILLAHGLELAAELADQLAAAPGWAVLNAETGGASTLFRAYADQVDPTATLSRESSGSATAHEIERTNELNHRIFQRLRAGVLEGTGPGLGFTSHARPTAAGPPLAALRSFVLSPWASSDHMREILSQLEIARRAVVEDFAT